MLKTRELADSAGQTQYYTLNLIFCPLLDSFCLITTKPICVVLKGLRHLSTVVIVVSNSAIINTSVDGYSWFAGARPRLCASSLCPWTRLGSRGLPLVAAYII